MSLNHDRNKKLSFSSSYKKESQKRKNARIPVEINGVFHYEDIDKEISDKCLINSISTGGVSFISGMVMMIDDIIRVSFPLSSVMITEYCKVTRVQGKEVGCKFTSPSNENQTVIQKFIFAKIF